ncbi:MAG: hypothetical protein KDB82_04205 [Planctomycetes bacterium]|nr:hypothetical protein [Planctomycetota bacterium]
MGGPPGAPGGAPSAVQSEAVGKFDKFAAFALAIPSGILAIVTLVIAIGYTNSEFDVGFFGFPKKSVADFDGGAASVQKLGSTVQITGFESQNYIGRTSEGEMDVAVLNVGSANNVNLGDVFTLKGDTAGVRLEFVVFDVGENISRAYILLGQDVSEGKERQFSLKRSDLEKLCGGGSNIEVERTFQDQIVRRYCEARTTAQ